MNFPFIACGTGERMNKSIKSLKIVAMAIAISSSMAFGAVSDKCVKEIAELPNTRKDFNYENLPGELATSVAKVKALCKKKLTCPADDKMTDAGLTTGCVKELPEDPKGIQALLKDVGLEAAVNNLETSNNERSSAVGVGNRTQGPKKILVPGDYETISDALGNADAGDTVFVKRGVYNENITLVMDVVLRGEDPLTTIIDGGRRGPTVMGTTGSEISHFTIRNGIEGILCENAMLYIHNNYVLDNHATGIAAFISLPEIANNVIYGNRWSGILAWGAKSLDSKIEQNVVLRNGYSGLALKGPSNVVVTNNIFMENQYYGVFADPASGQTRMDYNNIYKNYYPFNRFIKINRTNVSVDPLFRNPSVFKPDFFVQQKSPMVRRGQNRLDIGLLEDISVVRPKKEEAVEEPTSVPVPEPEIAEFVPEFEPESEPEPEPEPEPPPPPPPPKRVFVVEGITFLSGKAEIVEESFATLMTVVEMMQTYPEVSFKIVGHTDNQGKRDANQKLSEARAKAVMDFLISRGINEGRLEYEGKGQDQPVVPNTSAANRTKNRRIEFQRTDN